MARSRRARQQLDEVERDPRVGQLVSACALYCTKRLRQLGTTVCTNRIPHLCGNGVPPPVASHYALSSPFRIHLEGAGYGWSEQRPDGHP